MSLRHPLARVRGLGSAKEGTHHFIAIRLSSVALVPLFIWFGWFVFRLIGLGYADVRAEIGQPLNAALAIALIVTVFHHAQLGLQVVIEDYVHVRWQEYSLLIAVKLLAFLFALVGTIAVLKIALD
jgi:succinate dehydrogenase / fumarate reductase, membrane anchor subunit